jgi:hypothetical protein
MSAAHVGSRTPDTSHPVTTRVNQLLGLAGSVGGSAPDLIRVNEGDRLSVGRQRRAVSLADLLNLAATKRDGVHFLLGASDVVGRVGNLALRVGIFTARECDLRTVGADRDFAQLDPVIVKCGHLARGIIRGFRDPQIPEAGRIFHPRDLAVPVCGQRRRKR